ncbi:phage tail sheath subtilisin-like domain-containing protein [Candidatus Pacearchaeota archaeon]|nr:phage tail sheath subtilisin-like domain-containing protein [Candidatus Pacearchaeota archaeon]
MTGAASVQLKEIDLSTRVASFEGVYGAIAVPATKGSTVKPGYMTGDTQLLNKYTPNAKVEVGYDLSYFSALAYLERSNKLWVQRVANGATYAALVIKEDGAAGPNAGIPNDSDLIDPSSFVFAVDDALLIHSANEGEWGDDIRIKVTTISDNPDLIEPYSFLIEVFKSSNLVVPIENFLCSRVLGQLDGRGLNMFVEDVLESSNYIRAISNPLIDETVIPLTQATPLALNDGQDGAAVTETNMINGVNKFANKNDIALTLIMDGGYATPAYQIAIDTIAQLRQDCVGIFSTPYSAEVASDYMTELVNYRKTTLNLNSSYSAIYTPHLQINDRFNDRKIWIAPDGHVAGSVSTAAAKYEIWYPAAGYKRGILNVLDTRLKLTDGELDQLANNGVNPIKFAPGKGIVIWGQKTLQSRASALDRLNVRLLLIVIEPAIRDFLENFLFDLNDETVGDIMETKISVYLDGIKARKGIADFDVVSDTSNNTEDDADNYRRNVDIFIKPMKSIEYIPVRVVIVPESISFSQAAGAL